MFAVLSSSLLLVGDREAVGGWDDKGGHGAHFSFGRRLAERAGGWDDKGGHGALIRGYGPYRVGAHEVGGGGLVRGVRPLTLVKHDRMLII